MTGSGAPPPRAVAAGSLFAFLVLGLPDGMVGVVWPALRHAFGQPLASLGQILLASLVGYLAVTPIAGRALRRLGAGRMLIASSAAACAGAAAFAAAPWWIAIDGAAVLLGAAAGGLDAVLNTVVSLAGQGRLMNLLHASYGVGAALGPLVVTAALAAAASWRAAFGVLLLLEIALLVVWIALRGVLAPLPAPAAADSPPAAAEDSRPAAAAKDSQPPATAGSPPAAAEPAAAWSLVLWLSLAVCFLYTGAEVAAGVWSASFLQGPGGLPPALAGLAVFIYYAALTAGRAAAAGLGPRLTAENAVRIGVAGSVAGAVLLWANLAPFGSVIALAVTGLSFGPIFPALVTLTPARLGTEAAVSGVGWELAAAGVGGAGLSALVGVVLQADGLASLGPALLVLVLALAGLSIGLERARPTA